MALMPPIASGISPMMITALKVISQRRRALRRAGTLGALAAADAKSGARLWSFQTSQVWKASPMTYVFDNKQHIAIAVGQSIVAFALPD